MEEFFNKLTKKIEKAVKKDAKKIMKEVGDEQIYSVALVTDSNFITLYLGANTYENMKKRDEEYFEMFKDDWSEEEISKCRNGILTLTKWVPDEWGYSDGNNSNLNKISSLLFKKSEEDSDEYEENLDLFLEAVTTALKNVIAKEVFGKNSDKITFFVSMTDDDRTEDIENDSAKVLNSESLYEEFYSRKYL